MNNSTKNISRLIELCRQLLCCADRGDIQRSDDTCGVLFGMVRDSAYKILELAQKERLLHIRNGSWDKDDADEYPCSGEKKTC
jgi:hypothetical protein